MKWINEPRLSALEVTIEGQNVTFRDTVNNEYVNVQYVGDREPTFIVNNTSPRRVPYRKGKGLYRRDVYHYATRENATWLRAGQTVHRSAFSSLPHPFETRPRAHFEEVFILRTFGAGLLEGHKL